jgi:2,3-bisphosphoglycerate-independent phosphoglycerate mutase
LEPPFSDWVVAVTGDHATPASGGVLHTGDPTPFVVAAPSARADAVASFGEQQCRAGLLGVLAASDVMPLMCSHANRPRFLGHRPSAFPTIALPDHPEPFR